MAASSYCSSILKLSENQEPKLIGIFSERAINSQRHQLGDLEAPNPIKRPVLFFYFEQILTPCLWTHIQKNDLQSAFASLGPG